MTDGPLPLTNTDGPLNHTDPLVRELMAGEPAVPLNSRAEAYAIIQRFLVFTDYHELRRSAKSTTKRFLQGATGYSRAQLTRLIAQHRQTGEIRDRRVRQPQENE